MKIPPPPPGFELIPDGQGGVDIPPPPDGFEMIGADAPAAVSAEPVPETPDPDAKPQTWADYAEGLAQKVAQGVTFNFGDEAAAAAGSVFGLGPMFGGKDYRTILDEVHKREADFTKANPKTAIAAELAGGLATGLGTGATAARLIGGAPGLLRSALGAGLTAAPMAALNEVGELEGKDKTIGDYGQAALEGAGSGAAWGFGLGAAGHGIGRVVGPWASAAAQRLSDRGIRLTPGQLMGPNAKKIEDTVTSLPGANIMVRGRREEALADLNRVAVNEALQPIGVQLANDAVMGHDAVAAAGDAISDVYRRTVPAMRGVRDIHLDRDLANLANTLPHNQRGEFNAFVNRELNNVAPAPAAGGPAAIAGDDMQHLIETLRSEGNHLATAAGASHHDRELGRAFGHAADVMETNLAANSPAAVVAEYQAANRAFANLVRIEKAAGMSDTGVFSPAQLKNAIRTSDRSSRKRAVARGEALLQDLGTDAKVVIGNTLNDSGTPERAMMSTLLLGGGASMINPTLLLGPAALAALYSGPANRAFQFAATRGAGPRGAARRAIEQLTRAGAPAAGLASVQGD
jgi:hypothetical protein